MVVEHGFDFVYLRIQLCVQVVFGASFDFSHFNDKILNALILDCICVVHSSLKSEVSLLGGIIVSVLLVVVDRTRCTFPKHRDT